MSLTSPRRTLKQGTWPLSKRRFGYKTPKLYPNRLDSHRSCFQVPHSRCNSLLRKGCRRYLRREYTQALDNSFGSTPGLPDMDLRKYTHRMEPLKPEWRPKGRT